MKTVLEFLVAQAATNGMQSCCAGYARALRSRSMPVDEAVQIVCRHVTQVAVANIRDVHEEFIGLFPDATSTDADDLVLAAATLLVASKIPCRVVGARFGYSWTCWLAYRNEDAWVIVDVSTGAAPTRQSDERIDVDVPWGEQ